MILNIHSTTKGLLKQTFSVRVASQTHTTASTLASQTARSDENLNDNGSFQTAAVCPTRRKETYCRTMESS